MQLSDVFGIMRRKRGSSTSLVAPNQPENHLTRLDSQLRELCGDDAIYEAMQRFLLVEPDRQLPLLGDMRAIESSAESEKKAGLTEKARADFETAAKLGIYRQDQDSVRRLIISADELSMRENEHRIHRTLLSNLGKALEIAKKYYEKKSRGAH